MKILEDRARFSYLHDLEGLDLASVLDVRSSAKIDQGSATVDGALFSGDQLFDVVQLVLAVREHLPEVLFRDFQSVKALFLLEDPRGLVVQRLPVTLLNDTAVYQVRLVGKNATVVYAD